MAAARDALREQKKGDVDVAETISQERISKPMVEYIVDVSVPQVFDGVVDSVDVSVPQVDEVAQISPERIMEHIALEVHHEREQARIAAQKVYIPVLPVTEETVVPMPQIVEETVGDRTQFLRC